MRIINCNNKETNRGILKVSTLHHQPINLNEKVMLRVIFSLGIFLLGIYNLCAQDTITKRNNEQIICKIKEIGTDEIKYQPLGNDIIIVIDKNDVSKVVLSSGMVMKFQDSMHDKNSYIGQSKNAIKFRFLSPLYGYTDLTYERSLKPGSSMEFSLGLIGLGKHYSDDEANGASLRFGYKFIKSPDFYLKGLRYTHILKGAYFRPEIAASLYSRNSEQIFAGAILMNVGNQWVFDNFVVLDLYFGLGYGFSSNDEFGVQYGYSTGSSEFPIAISSGFRIGFLFK
jgi:hypothetical protein